MSASPHVLSNLLRSPPTPLLLLLLLLLALSGGLAYGQVPNPITGIDDTANPQCRGQTVNAGFGVANVYESPQPHTHTTDGQSIRFDLVCECDNGANWRIWNPNSGSGHGWNATSIACPNYAASGTPSSGIRREVQPRSLTLLWKWVAKSTAST